MRLIFVPQYPTPMRYQEWWIWKFEEEFTKAGFEVITLGKDYANSMKYRRGDMSMFSPIHAAIEFECQQIDEFMNLELQNDDIMFVADLSFPGFFMNALFHKPVKNLYAFCHATSLNNYDYFSKVRNEKFSIETVFSYMCKKIFVGSHYHRNKLFWKNISVTYLPYPPHFQLTDDKSSKRTNDIISVSRPSPQKVDLKFEVIAEKKYGKINRQTFYKWIDYEEFLLNSKVLLITANEETFGYQIVDAVMHGCIPIAKNSLSYPELLPEEYLYNSADEMVEKIGKALNGNLPVPELKCHEVMEGFYKQIIKNLKGE